MGASGDSLTALTLIVDVVSSASRKDLKMDTSKPSGLISFMCWVMHDPTTNKAFHGNEVAVMERFGLDGATRDQIKRVGEVHDEPQSREIAERLCDDHLLGTFLEIWTGSIASSVSRPPRRPGWISWMYYVRHDEVTNAECRRHPRQVMASFKITDHIAIGKIEKIAEDPRAPAAKAAARYLFKTYVVPELLETRPPRFW